MAELRIEGSQETQIGIMKTVLIEHDHILKGNGQPGISASIAEVSSELREFLIRQDETRKTLEKADKERALLLVNANKESADSVERAYRDSESRYQKINTRFNVLLLVLTFLMFVIAVFGYFHVIQDSKKGWINLPSIFSSGEPVYANSKEHN